MQVVGHEILLSTCTYGPTCRALLSLDSKFHSPYIRACTLKGQGSQILGIMLVIQDSSPVMTILFDNGALFMLPNLYSFIKLNVDNHRIKLKRCISSSS